jgi:hypothetical protein
MSVEYVADKALYLLALMLRVQPTVQIYQMVLVIVKEM